MRAEYLLHHKDAPLDLEIRFRSRLDHVHVFVAGSRLDRMKLTSTGNVVTLVSKEYGELLSKLKFIATDEREEAVMDGCVSVAECLEGNWVVIFVKKPEKAAGMKRMELARGNTATW